MTISNDSLRLINSRTLDEAMVKIVCHEKAAMLAFIGAGGGRVSVHTSDAKVAQIADLQPARSVEGLWKYRSEIPEIGSIGSTDVAFFGDDQLALLSPDGANIHSLPSLDFAYAIDDSACYQHVFGSKDFLIIGGGRDPIVAASSPYGGNSKLLLHSSGKGVRLADGDQGLCKHATLPLLAIARNFQGGSLFKVMLLTDSWPVLRNAAIGAEGVIAGVFSHDAMFLATLSSMGPGDAITLAVYDIPKMKARFFRRWTFSNSNHSTMYANVGMFVDSSNQTIHVPLPDGSIALVESQSGAELGREVLHTSPLCCFAISPNQRLAFGSYSDSVIKIFEINEQSQLSPRLELDSSFVGAERVSPSSDESVLTLISSSGVNIFDT